MRAATPPGTPHRRRVLRRLRSLATGELVNIPLQAGLWFGVVGLPVTAPNLLGFSLFALLLVEGAGYWLAKLRQLGTGGRALPGIRFFRLARLATVPPLVAGIAATGYASVVTPGAGCLPGLGFAVMAALEYVNYFHVQLTHDTVADLRRLRRVGLRRSHLARDLSGLPGLSQRTTA